MPKPTRIHKAKLFNPLRKGMIMGTGDEVIERMLREFAGSDDHGEFIFSTEEGKTYLFQRFDSEFFFKELEEGEDWSI